MFGVLRLTTCSARRQGLRMETTLTAATVAERLGMSRWALLRLVKAGRIAPAQKLDGIRGAYLFDPAEVERVRRERAA